MAIILITGSSTGIGFATAELLAKNGHKVYASMRNPKNSPQLAELAEKNNLPITILPLDVDHDESVKEAVTFILTEEAGIDVLINNAGIDTVGPIEELPLEEIKKIMETNYFGTVRCIQAVLPSMRERKSGCIINVTSIAGKVYTNFHGPYCASKAAVEAFSESLAQEIKEFNIRVAIVQPGVIDTGIFYKNKPVPEITSYPAIKRFRALVLALLDNHVPPVVVAEVIRHVIENNPSQLRFTAGPEAEPLISFRSSISDEDWIDSASMDEQYWAVGMKEIFQLDIMPYLEK
ncbi:SDR family oxidoreductase [Lunatibacter salilacus]|uniref:SDR family oxidoreductase n=1 Tax=Lunatibacter salilacus TaxID=2483804 RepID=UPI00131CFA70|nr:SDR family oxidoreductase [Lunatibacter salilacus]